MEDKQLPLECIVVGGYIIGTFFTLTVLGLLNYFVFHIDLFP